MLQAQKHISRKAAQAPLSVVDLPNKVQHDTQTRSMLYCDYASLVNVLISHTFLIVAKLHIKMLKTEITL